MTQPPTRDAGVRCVFASGDELGETPLWCDRTNALWWIDIEKPRLQSFEPASGRHRAFAFPQRFLGSAALRREGGFLLALDRSLYLFDPEERRLEHFCDVETAPLDNRLNDGRCDGLGRFWIGTMDVGLQKPTGSLYRIGADRTVAKSHGGVIVSNSIAIAPDQRTFYYSDTRRFVMWAFDFDARRGALSNKRVFVDHSASRDRPDGACVDEEGYVWVAMFGGARVARYSPDGRLDRTIPLPVTNPTCVCFGGADLSTLYITSARKFLSREQLDAEPLAGALLAVTVPTRGLPEARFAG